MVRLRQDAKATVGASNVFEWVAPGPFALVSAGAPPVVSVSAVSLTLYPTTGPVTLTLACPDPLVSVTGISDERRTLVTAASPFAAAPGWLGRNGEAWLVTARQAVQVRAVDAGASSVELADPLPRDLDVAGAYLVLSRREVALPGPLTAVVRRDVRWVVQYQIRHGLGTALAAVAQSETGLLQIVPQPFDLGLVSTDLVQYMRGIGSTASSGSQGWGSILASAEAEVALRVRAELTQRGLTEDDFPAPARLRDVALDLAAALAIDLVQPDQADRLRARALERMDLVMRATPWVDDSRDGEVDPGEVQEVGQSWARDFSASRTTTRAFRVGGSH
jgi:hypothetical protein